MKKFIWIGVLLLVVINGAILLATRSDSASTTRTLPTETVLTEPTMSGIRFTQAKWNEVLRRAKADKKLVFLDAYASWCGPCKLMQKNVFTRAEVGDYFNKQFINVAMDMEEGEGPSVAERYPLDGYPTLLFIDGDGNVVKKVLGYQSADELLQVAKSVGK